MPRKWSWKILNLVMESHFQGFVGTLKRERKKKEKRGIKRERKLNQSFQEHVVEAFGIPRPLAAPRPLTVMAPAFHVSRQPPLSQNPAYAPDSLQYGSPILSRHFVKKKCDGSQKFLIEAILL